MLLRYNMPIRQIEVLTDELNAAVVRMPGRAYPGLVVQGDGLFRLHTYAKSAFEYAAKTGDAAMKRLTGNVLAEVSDLMERYGEGCRAGQV